MGKTKEARNVHYNLIEGYSNDKETREKFTEARHKGGYTQLEMSELLGLNSGNAVISKLEKGTLRVSDRTMTLLMLLLNLHPRYELIERKAATDIKKADKDFMKSVKEAEKNNKERFYIHPDAPLVIEPPEHKFGDLLLEYRTKAYLIQEKFAELLNLEAGKSIVSNYENGHKKPSRQNWTLFLLALDRHPFYKVNNIAPEEDEDTSDDDIEDIEDINDDDFDDSVEPDDEPKPSESKSSEPKAEKAEEDKETKAEEDIEVVKDPEYSQETPESDEFYSQEAQSGDVEQWLEKQNIPF